MAVHDALTGLYNRRYFNDKLKSYSNLANRTGQPLSCLMLDIDLFKKFNDSFGHQAGDEVLVAVAKELGYSTRDSDVLARYGGEEFIVLLPQLPHEKAQKVAEKLREAVEELVVEYETHEFKVTISVGVSTSHEFPKMGEGLVRNADDALYMAKAAGRNCVKTKIVEEVADEDSPSK